MKALKRRVVVKVTAGGQNLAAQSWNEKLRGIAVIIPGTRVNLPTRTRHAFHPNSIQRLTSSACRAGKQIITVFSIRDAELKYKFQVMHIHLHGTRLNDHVYRPEDNIFASPGA